MSDATAPPPAFAATLTLLLLLLAVDALFIIAHVLHVWSPWLDRGHFSIESDDGMAELYQYIKWVWLLACLALAWWRARLPVYLGWALLFSVLLLDDVTQLHERTGALLGERFALPAVLGLRAADLGELAYAATLGGLAVGMVALTFRRGCPAARQVSADVLLLLGVLAFFGVFCDALHTIAHFRVPVLAPVLTLVEDGGEMVVVSALTACVFDLASNAGRPRLALASRIGLPGGRPP